MGSTASELVVAHNYSDEMCGLVFKYLTTGENF